MAPDMMDGDQGDSQGKGRRLGKAEAHQHRADQAGGIGHRYGVNIGAGAAGADQGLFRQGGDGLHMLAGGNLRNHAAVQGMEIHLGGDGVGQHMPSVLHHRNGGLVAGGFKG